MAVARWMGVGRSQAYTKEQEATNGAAGLTTRSKDATILLLGTKLEAVDQKGQESLTDYRWRDGGLLTCVHQWQESQLEAVDQ